MCGIVGLLTNSVFRNDIQFFEDALVADTIRGHDSTGVMMMSSDGSFGAHKSACTGSEMIKTKRFQKIMEDSFKAKGITVMTGHNRAATIGSVNSATAHPFRHDHIIGVHNGTLRTHKELADTEVDSDAIMCALSKANGQEETKKVLETINGAYALVWYNLNDGTVNFARNSERPLFLAHCQTLSWLTWASEKPMLQWLVAKRLHGKYTVEALPVGKWMSVDITDKKAGLAPKKVCSFTPKKEVVYSGGYRGNYNGYEDNWRDDYDDPIPPVGTELDMIPCSFEPYSANTDWGSIVMAPLDATQWSIYATYSLSATEEEFNKMKDAVITCRVGTAYDRWINSRRSKCVTLTKLDIKSKLLMLEQYKDGNMSLANDQLVTKEEWAQAKKDGCAWCNEPLNKPEDSYGHQGSVICDGCMSAVDYMNECEGGKHAIT